MTSPFIHLRVHSEYSLIDGTVRVKPLVKFYKAALAEGIKPIAGCDVYVFDPASDAAPALLVLLAQNEAGYRKLGQLLSKAYDRPRIVVVHQPVDIEHHAITDSRLIVGLRQKLS